MRNTLLFSIALSAVLVMGAGCVGTETGKSVAGFPAKDTVHDRYEKPVPQVVAATREVLKRNGKMLVDNVVDNSFQAKVNQHNVWVKVADMDGKITTVDVQARGPVGGDLDLAHEISKQIGMQLVAQGQ